MRSARRSFLSAPMKYTLVTMLTTSVAIQHNDASASARTLFWMASRTCYNATDVCRV